MNTIERADHELIDLLVAIRGGPHWTPGNIRAAIALADRVGVPWQTTMRALLNLAELPQCTPAHLGR